MCHDSVAPDGSARVSSGGARSTRAATNARIEFIRYNYVVYDNLGSHLDTGFLAFLRRATSPASATEFYYVESGHAQNLRALFYANNMSAVPDRFEQYYTFPNNRYIYLFIDHGPGQIIEIDYTDATDWSMTTYEWEEGAWEPVDQVEPTPGNTRVRLNRTRFQDTYAIALPGSVTPDTAANILIGRSGGGSGFQATRDFCRVQQVNAPPNPQVDLRLVVFDPAHIVDQTARVLNYYIDRTHLVDARNRRTGLSGYLQNVRNRGILACLCKQLVDSQNALQNDVRRPQVNSAFNRYANYGRRKARFVDNLYNFLTHPIMERLETELMAYQIQNVSYDGYVWLQIVEPVSELIGVHTLLSEYFMASAEKPSTEGAWGTFFRSRLSRGTATDNSMVQRWNSTLQSIDYVKLMVGVAETRSFYLVSEYTSGNLSHANFRSLLEADARSIRTLPPYISSTTQIANKLRTIRGTMQWASRLGQLGAVCQGHISASSFTAALDSISDTADNHQMRALAARASLVKNAIDVWTHGAEFLGRVGVEDYDAAFGRGLCFAASITELSYVIATGSTIGGPVGAVVAIVAATGAIIVLLGTDSETERYMRHMIWGRQPRQSTDQEAWCTAPFNQWHDTPDGVEHQLKSLINLLHKYEVRHKFDNNTNVIAIEIETKFLPDNAKFMFYGLFEMTDGSRTIIRARIRYSSRRRGQYVRARFTQTGGRNAVISVNTRMENGSSSYTIKLNIRTHTGHIRNAKGWVVCYPFGHNEFAVPHDGAGFYMNNITQSRITFNDLDFSTGNWQNVPAQVLGT